MTDLDPAAVHADDEFLDALAEGRSAGEFTDHRLAHMLAAWRQDVDSEPMPEMSREWDGSCPFRLAQMLAVGVVLVALLRAGVRVVRRR